MKLTLPQGYNRIRFRRRRRSQHRHGTLLPITELGPGERGEIACIKGNRKITQRLADLGLTPNTCISIVKTAPFNGPVEIAVRGCKLAIGRDIAENILVKTKEN
ncbi:MAG: FeoA family protein [Candidatus Bathyarchaeia archaeon]